MISVETVTVDGKPVAVARQRGKAKTKTKKPTIVLVHGAGNNHRTWEPLLEALEGVDVIAPSLPGRSGSQGPPLDTIPTVAAWIRRVADATHCADIIVVGHSAGGAVPIELGVLHALGEVPELVGIGLLCTGARLRVHPTIFQVVEKAASESSPADLAGLLWHPDADPGLVARARAARAEVPPLTELVDWRAADRFDRMNDVASIRVPALVVSAEEDPLTPPKYGRYLAEHIPNATLVSIPGAGHMVPVERPDEIAKVLRDLIARVEG